MSPELKTRWLEALRSGEYKQGRAYLRKDDKFCCLGVLCDLIDSTQWGLLFLGGGGYVLRISQRGRLSPSRNAGIGRALS